MPFIKFTDDEIVKRLRWVMAAAIIFSMANTLAGQPAAYWHNPALAMRGDGLPINSLTNYTFEFFLGSGWLPFVLAAMVYLAGMFLAASTLPRKLALIFIFSVIFGHYYGGSNWLAVRWHLGFLGPIFYGLAVSAGVVFAAFPPSGPKGTIKSLRWIMLFAMLADTVVTLVGQPHGYWHKPLLVDEGNQVSKFFLEQGWYAYVIEQLVIGSAVYGLVSILSRPWALTIAFCFIFGGFSGASNWFFYRWIWGWQAPVIFGCVLSAAIVLSTFPVRRWAKEERGQQQEPLAASGLPCKMY
jgi:hypothetical protein